MVHPVGIHCGRRVGGRCGDGGVDSPSCRFVPLSGVVVVGIRIHAMGNHQRCTRTTKKISIQDIDVRDRWMYSRRMAQVAFVVGASLGFTTQLVSTLWMPVVIGIWVACLFSYTLIIGDHENLPESTIDGSLVFLMGFGWVQWLAFGWQWLRF